MAGGAWTYKYVAEAFTVMKCCFVLRAIKFGVMLLASVLYIDTCYIDILWFVVLLDCD